MPCWFHREKVSCCFIMDSDSQWFCFPVVCWGNVRCLKKPLPPIYTWLILFPRGAKGKGGAWEERRNTKLVCRGMKDLVCCHRPARASAAPRSCMTCLGSSWCAWRGCAQPQPFPNNFAFSEPQAFPCREKSLASVIKLFCSVWTKLSARIGYTLQKMWLCGHLIA